MFDLSTFNMDRFVHKFIQNLGLRIESSACKKFNKITFLTYVDKSFRLEQLLLYTAEKMKEINMQENLDLSNEKSVKCFIDNYANSFDRLTYFTSARFVTSHLKHINTKILQKVKVRRKNSESIKKGEVVKAYNNSVPCNKKMRTNLANKLAGPRKKSMPYMVYNEKRTDSHDYKKSKLKKTTMSEKSQLLYHDTITSRCKGDNGIQRKDNDKQRISDKHDLVNCMMNVARKEVEMAEKSLQLYIKDVEYLRRRIQVTLHIAKKSRDSYNRRDETEYHQTLCHYAIMCLIEPSEQGYVLLEDDLTIVIQKYLSCGYKYHFEFQSNSKESYSALLILSQYGKILVKHMNTTIMHTICGILQCDVQNILVLHSPEERL